MDIDRVLVQTVLAAQDFDKVEAMFPVRVEKIEGDASFDQ